MSSAYKNALARTVLAVRVEARPVASDLLTQFRELSQDERKTIYVLLSPGAKKVFLMLEREASVASAAAMVAQMDEAIEKFRKAAKKPVTPKRKRSLR